VSILEAALEDDNSGVAEEGQRLLARWLQQEAGGCPVQLLLMLDVYKHPGEGRGANWLVVLAAKGGPAGWCVLELSVAG
jgi:hypothetical protein